jgi:predicted SAM-dependent methyltransferase
MRGLRQELSISRAHRRSVRAARKYAHAKALKLNIGCGPNLKPGWVNIDLVACADLQLDMREAMPLPDKCAQMIYSEHFFEHIDYPRDAMHFLSECHRVLEPGGVFSVGVPDTSWPLLDYGGTGPGGYFETAHRWHAGWCKTKLEHINYHFRQDGEHRFMWDFETLEGALARSGFTNIERRDYRPGLDTESRALGTLYVDATKPNR